MEKLKWKTERRKLSDLVPYKHNSSIFLYSFYDAIGRRRKGYLKICECCGELYHIPRHLLYKRKYCSQNCSGRINGSANGIKSRLKTIARNKSSINIEKVRKSLLKHYADNPRNQEDWYIHLYGENYMPKKSKHSHRWKILSVKLRESNNCQRCDGREKLEVHHIIPYAVRSDNSMFNLVVLCKSCHKIIECNNRKLMKILNDWDVVRDTFRLQYEDIGRPILYD